MAVNSAMSAAALPGVFRGLLNGVHERNEGGVFYVRGEEGAYMFPREFGNAQFAESLQAAIDDAPGYFFVVEERDGHLHVLAYERERVAREALAAAGVTLAAAGVADADDPPRVAEVDD
jgi:hypothetical protein